MAMRGQGGEWDCVHGVRQRKSIKGFFLSFLIKIESIKKKGTSESGHELVTWEDRHLNVTHFTFCYNLFNVFVVETVETARWRLVSHSTMLGAGTEPRLSG